VTNVLAVPAVLGLVALGAAAVVTRSLMDMAGYRLKRRPAGTRASRPNRRRSPNESGHKARIEPGSGQP